MTEFEIFVAFVCGVALIFTMFYHHTRTFKRVQWKKDLYKLYAIRDEFLLLRIDGKIENDEIFQLVYTVFNFGIAGGHRPRVSWFIKALLRGYATAQPRQNILSVELKNNAELADVFIKYFGVLFIEIIYKRSLVLKTAFALVKILRRIRLSFVVKLANKTKEKATEIFKDEEGAYRAYQFFDNLRAA